MKLTENGLMLVKSAIWNLQGYLIAEEAEGREYKGKVIEINIEKDT